jgi:hypothetical protein
LRCNRQPNHPTGCRWESGSAATPPTSNDKPEAGRTCKPWCGTASYPVASYVVVVNQFGYCRDGCAVVGRPLNPAPRHVEHDRPKCDGCGKEIDPEICGCGDPINCHWSGDGHPPIPLGCDCYRAKPRPVERCSCPEATRYKAALEAIAAYVNNKRLVGIRVDEIDGIARRALALGGEET